MAALQALPPSYTSLILEKYLAWRFGVLRHMPLCRKCGNDRRQVVEPWKDFFVNAVGTRVVPSHHVGSFRLKRTSALGAFPPEDCKLSAQTAR